MGLGRPAGYSGPKVELHCHLDGILDPEMLREIRREDPGFPVLPEVLEQAYPVDSYQRFCDWWRYSDPLAGQLDFYRPILSRYVTRLKAEQVVYAEIMVSSGELPQDVSEALEKVASFREWLDGLEQGEIQVELMVAFGRSKPAEQIERLAARNIALYEAGLIVGIAVAGPEQGYPVRPFEKTMARYRDAGMGIEVHAGEWCGPESVWDALRYGHPDRIGHGVAIFQDPSLVDVILERGIHVEMCPTSNLKTGSITRLDDHPIGKARDLGMSFSVNTDDPGPFLNSMSSEYALLEDVFGFREEDFQAMFARSMEARFFSGEGKTGERGEGKAVCW